jgi:hypothetical protein
MPLAVGALRRCRHRGRIGVRVCRVGCMARRGQSSVYRVSSGVRGRGPAVDRLLQWHRQRHVSHRVLDRPVLRLQVLRVAAAAARSRAEGVGAGAGGAVQDAALPAQSAFSVQHAERDLDADSRQPQFDRQLGRDGIGGISALHARPGSDQEGHGGAGARRAQPVPRHREDALRAAPGHRVRDRAGRHEHADAQPAAAAADRERHQVRHLPA